MGHDTTDDRALPRFFRLLALTAWIGALWGLMSGLGGPPPISRFLSPDYFRLPEMGAAILILFWFLTYSDIPKSMGMGALAGLIRLALLLLPIIYLPTAVTSELSPAAFTKRFVAGAQIEDRTYAGSAAPAGERFPSSDGRTVNILRLSLQPSEFLGRRTRTEGLIYRSGELGENRFYCYRLLMWCCAADARPIGVLVESESPITLKSGAWVSVEGIVEKSSFEGKPVIRMKEAAVKEIPPPPNPYVFLGWSLN